MFRRYLPSVLFAAAFPLTVSSARAEVTATASASAELGSGRTDDAPLDASRPQPPDGTLAGPSPGLPVDAASPSAARDCAFGLLFFCLVESDLRVNAPKTKFRLEGLIGYKISNLYYRNEIRGCQQAGCSLNFGGPSFSLDGFYNLAGNPHSDDYVDLGLSVSYMPVVSNISNNPKGFAGELGDVRPGGGSLAYVPVRLTLRRSNFLYLIKSKYLISSFGAGLAFPVTNGAAGESFTGGDSAKLTIGGRIGAQYPITDTINIGVATNWSVIWYGATFGQASFMTSYGMNLAYQL